MAKAEWGRKRVCPSCGASYYDMKKNPPVCPKCGAVFSVESAVKSRRSRIAEEKNKPSMPPVDEADIAISGDDEADNAVIEDTDELGEDVDVEEVLDVESQSEEDSR